MQVCNHRLKQLTGQNEIDENRLRRVRTNLQILTTSNVHPNDSYQAKMEQLEEDLNNLTLKKRKFRSLERSINTSMDRMHRKMDAIKLKVLVRKIFMDILICFLGFFSILHRWLKSDVKITTAIVARTYFSIESWLLHLQAFESIRFDKNDWSRYALPDEVQEIRLGFRSDKKTGTILSVGQTVSCCSSFRQYHENFASYRNKWYKSVKGTAKDLIVIIRRVYVSLNVIIF